MGDICYGCKKPLAFGDPFVRVALNDGVAAGGNPNCQDFHPECNPRTRAHPTAESAEDVVLPFAYAYRYADGYRFSNGEAINGNRPVAAIPLYDAKALTAAEQRAAVAERERCAKVAENYPNIIEHDVASDIASAIRGQS